MEEALFWSEFPVRSGDRWAELGCAGRIESGPLRTGTDGTRHRSGRRRALRAFVARLHARQETGCRPEASRLSFDPLAGRRHERAPNYTLDTVEAIVTHAAVDVRGLLPDAKTAGLEAGRRGPGLCQARSRLGLSPRPRGQLAHNRREICLAAT